MKNVMEVLKQAGLVEMSMDDETSHITLAHKKPASEKNVSQYLKQQQQKRAVERLPCWMDGVDADLVMARHHVNTLYFYVKLLGFGVVTTLCVLMVLIFWMLGGVA